MPGVVQALSYILSDHTGALIVSLFEVWRSSQRKERLGLGLPGNFGLGGRSTKSSSSEDFGVAAGFPSELCHYTLLLRWLWPSMRYVADRIIESPSHLTCRFWSSFPVGFWHSLARGLYFRLGAHALHFDVPLTLMEFADGCESPFDASLSCSGAQPLRLSQWKGWELGLPPNT